METEQYAWALQRVRRLVVLSSDRWISAPYRVVVPREALAT